MIDTSKWGNYRIGDLFDVSRPIARSAKKYSKGNVPFVASGNFNNGVFDYLEPKSEIDFDEGNCITVSPVDGSAFYQKKRFLGRGGAGSSIIVLRGEFLNELNGQFICTIIRRTCCWNYANMGNKDVLRDTCIKLPATHEGTPDWDYMESYMANIIDESEQCLANLKKADDIKKQIDVRKWREFKIDELFNIETGGDLILFKNSDGNIPVVSHSAENNGIQKRVNYIDGRPIYNASKTLSLADRGNFKCFVQDEDFYVGTRVKALISKNDVSKYCLFFLSVAIDALAVKFSYKDNATGSLGNHCIKLPVNGDNEPDWTYMEEYVKDMIEKTNSIVETLKSI